MRNLVIAALMLSARGLLGCGLAMTDFELAPGTSSTDTQEHGTGSESNSEEASASDSAGTDPPLPLEWVPLPGGTFELGSSLGTSLSIESPIVEVTVAAFEILRTEVTVAQYEACVEAGACDPPKEWKVCGKQAAANSLGLLHLDEDYPNWGRTDRRNHPINCVSHEDAQSFCDWSGGALPSEAQWEYAAQSGEPERKFPWGDKAPACGVHAVFYPTTTGPIPVALEPPGCGEDRTFAVCEANQGKTDQGLCDMGGNVCEWVADHYHKGYAGYPHATTGDPWLDDGGGDHIIRGGGFNTIWGLSTTRTGWRFPWAGDNTDYGIGFRCVRPASE